MQYEPTLTKAELLAENHPAETSFDTIPLCLDKIEAVADVMTTMTDISDEKAFFQLDPQTINALGVILKDAAQDIIELNLLGAETCNKFKAELKRLKGRG